MRLFSNLHIKSSAILFISLFSPGSFSADELVYIRAGTLIDVQSGVMHHDQVISIRGDRIESVDDASVGASGFSDVALRDAINAGEIEGPRLRVSGPSLGITGGHCDNNLLPVEYDVRSDGVADGPWAVRTKVRENIKYGADLIKFCATGGVLSKGDSVGGPQYTFEEVKALVDEAHMHDRKVAAHAHGAVGIKTAIRAGVDSIEHASLIASRFKG